MNYSLSTLPISIEDIIQRPRTRTYNELRDRVAYVYVTGCFPTHLRSEANELLRLISSYSQTPTSFDRRSGTLLVCEEAVVRLSLAAHPMAKKVRTYINRGYRIATGRGSKARRPYGKVFLCKNGEHCDEQIVVQRDGSVLDKW